MSLSFELSVDISRRYSFDKKSLSEIKKNTWVKNQWPLVYFIQNESKKVAYVGESTNFGERIKNHLSNPKKSVFDQISIIGSDKFNKSATLDIESKLIQYIFSEGTYELQNGNFGLVNHNYFQQDLYEHLFKQIWKELIEDKIVSKSLEEIENSELFKYSPYKSLNEDQYASVLEIIETLNGNDHNKVFVKGSAGTGKTVLATYLIKLLTTNITNISVDDLNDVELNELLLIQDFQKKHPNPKIGLVIAMTSLRETLKRVFSHTPGLKSSMVIGPSDSFKKEYDLLIVDEAHRLRQYNNISWRGAFKKNNRKLGLDDSGTELDWIKANSKKQLFFYDSAQSVKPSDVPKKGFSNLLEKPDSITLELKSQMRVKGGNDYITFIDRLMHQKLDKDAKFSSEKYELLLFDDLNDLYDYLKEKENDFGLCRLIAGYSWPWLSDPRAKNPNLDAVDIEIDGLNFQWNTTDKDWINSENAFQEIGCIHTTQGYDLNYTGIILGHEIIYNTETDTIEINREQYFDKYGKQGVDDHNELKAFIINIYKTILYRAIQGTFIYACDKNLNNYLRKHISVFKKTEEISLRVLEGNKIKPFVNSVPFYDISVAAGDFSDLQINEDTQWVELPPNITVKEDYFVCKVVGESMNKKIPSGSLCLFKKYQGGSRQGKIVLVQHFNIQESDFGAGYTVKSYHSEKLSNEDSWSHTAIVLKPMSTEKIYDNIILKDDEIESLKVLGEFLSII